MDWLKVGMNWLHVGCIGCRFYGFGAGLMEWLQA